jgi:hypothetical protein
MVRIVNKLQAMNVVELHLSPASTWCIFREYRINSYASCEVAPMCPPASLQLTVYSSPVS